MNRADCVQCGEGLQCVLCGADQPDLRAKAEELFAKAVAQGMHAPFGLDVEYWGRDYANKLLGDTE